MIRTVMKIDGMSCGMCESHMNDTVRNTAKVRKVTSSFKKGETVIESDAPLDETLIRKAIEATGYHVLAFTEETFEKKGLFGFHKK